MIIKGISGEAAVRISDGISLEITDLLREKNEQFFKILKFYIELFEIFHTNYMCVFCQNFHIFYENSNTPLAKTNIYMRDCRKASDMA